jgi:hypothetical protein
MIIVLVYWKIDAASMAPLSCVAAKSATSRVTLRSRGFHVRRDWYL